MKITKIKELYFLREETFICFKYYARYKKVTRNFKLKEKYYVNEKTHLAISNNFVPYHSLKISKRGGGGWWWS